MLLLVVADNFVGLYAGWEGVGLASYLLIGFWYYKPTAATAAKKAFVMNRVGDAGLALAIFVIFANFGTLSYSGVFGQAAGADYRLTPIASDWSTFEVAVPQGAPVRVQSPLLGRHSAENVVAAMLAAAIHAG